MQPRSNFSHGSSAERRARRARLCSEVGIVAVHEAGHTIAHVLLDYPFQYVTLNPSKRIGCTGRVVYWLAEFPDQDTYPDAFRLVSEQEAMTLLAGAAAECILTGSYSSEGCSSDFEDVAKYLTPLANNVDELSSYQQWLFYRTLTMLRTNWEMVARVADTLLALPASKRTLTQTKVKSICRQVAAEALASAA